MSEKINKKAELTKVPLSDKVVVAAFLVPPAEHPLVQFCRAEGHQEELDAGIFRPGTREGVTIWYERIGNECNPVHFTANAVGFHGS